MTLVAVKNLLEERGRVIVSCTGVAFAVMLVLVLWGISIGTLRQAGALVKNSDADVWVVQQGFTDIAHGFSVLPTGIRPRLARIDGVRDVHPVAVAARELTIGGDEYSLQLVGYDTAAGVGGPWSWASEERQPRRGEIVVDETFARAAGLEVGDAIRLAGRDRRIVARSAGTTGFASWIGFAPVEDVRGMSRLENAVNFYALQTERGEASAVARAVREEVEDVTAYTRPEFVANNQREVREGVQPVLFVMLGVAFLVGLAVVGLTIFTATIEKSREYGVLAAIGADSRALTGVVLRQAAAVSAAGFALGTALVPAAGWVIQQLSPRVEVVLPAAVFPAVAAGALLMALLASYAPVRRLAALDPAAVFRA